jgi:uracil-DNA glycosylase family 4
LTSFDVETVSAPEAPPRDCQRCPRLVAFREEQRTRHPDWHNAPVPSFGQAPARLLIVGLAPGLQGANRTGRPFTGDWAGDLLYATLLKFGFATGVYDERPDDGLELVGARIANAVRCVPPQNKPDGAEITNCRLYLTSELEALSDAAAIVALGRIAHDSLCRALGVPLKSAPFKHGARHTVDSYHCSRYNTNTGVLTTEMFEAVFAAVRAHVDAPEEEIKKRSD